MSIRFDDDLMSNVISESEFFEVGQNGSSVWTHSSSRTFLDLQCY